MKPEQENLSERTGPLATAARAASGIRDMLQGLSYSPGSSDEHRRTVAALRDSQDTVQALLDATTETALLIDTDGRIIALNDIACERLGQISPQPVGLRKEELIGRCVFDLFPGELRERRKARNDEVVGSGRPARFQDERGGLWMDNSIYPMLDADGRVFRLAIFSYDITRLKEAEDGLARTLEAERERARRDALTWSLNHGAIVEELHRLVEGQAAEQTHVIAVADIDGLKAINDQYGHMMGDAVLVAVAEALGADGAVVGRYGGDEFVAILQGADRPRGERYVAAVTRTLHETQIQDGRTKVIIPVRASIGISVHPDEASAATSLIELADARMYAAKRDRPVVFPRRAA